MGKMSVGPIARAHKISVLHSCVKMPSDCAWVFGLLLSLPYMTTCSAKRPAEASLEELLETADSWLIDYDEDDDERLSLLELEQLKKQLQAQTASPAAQQAPLPTNTLMKMVDADDDGFATRNELVDMLKRMKGFDGGHVAREDAKTPQAADGYVYGESHAQRMERNKKMRKNKSATAYKRDELR